ncbi:MAG: hypothetical protein GY953_17630 [bacterium]|nr:hypothetical protein [bacterium]
MDLKVYYRKIREVEAAIPDADVVIVSRETPDGGRAGVRSEVARLDAAKLVVEGKARLAPEAEAAEYREQVKQASEKAREQAVINKLQVSIVAEPKSKPERSSKTKK